MLDATIETGNPADSDRYIDMVERVQSIYGKLSEAVAADGGNACSDNLLKAKSLGVKEVAFQKRNGLAIEEMTSTKKTHKTLCNFCAGIETNVSELKLVYGLTRSSWCGWKRFKAYVWSSISCYNLVKIARLNST